MKAILEFDLPEDNHEFQNATQGAKMKSVLWEMREYIRHRLKYDEYNYDQFEVLNACQSKLIDLLFEENIDLDS
jgi:hypothetical protein